MKKHIKSTIKVKNFKGLDNTEFDFEESLEKFTTTDKTPKNNALCFFVFSCQKIRNHK